MCFRCSVVCKKRLSAKVICIPSYKKRVQIHVHIMHAYMYLLFSTASRGESVEEGSLLKGALVAEKFTEMNVNGFTHTYKKVLPASTSSW